MVPVSVLLLASVHALAEQECISQLEILNAEARYTTRLFRGKPTRRDVVVEVEVRSTSTVAMSWVELGVFLGASLEDISSTRPEALPTRQARTLKGGGIAFRAARDVLLPAGATRQIAVRRKALPLDKDLYGVKVVPVRCKRVYAVGDATIYLPSDQGPPEWLLWAAFLLLVATAVLILTRLRR